MTVRFEHLIEIHEISKNRKEIAEALYLLDKVKEEDLRLRDYFARTHTAFFMDGVRHFGECMAESIAAEIFGMYRLANVSLRSGLDDFRVRLFFQQKLDASSSIKLTRFNRSDPKELEQVKILISEDDKVASDKLSSYYFFWDLGQTKSYPSIDRKSIIPTHCQSDWDELLSSLDRDTHLRPDIFAKVGATDFGYIVIEDIEKIKFNEQQIKHWDKNIKLSYTLFEKIKESYLSQYSKPDKILHLDSKPKPPHT